MKTRLQLALFLAVFAFRLGDAAGGTIQLGSRLELFVDDYLVERFDGTALKLHEPAPAGVALRFDSPWEGAFSGYITVIDPPDRRRFCPWARRGRSAQHTP